MTLARRRLAQMRLEPMEPGAVEVQRYANAGRLAAGVSQELISALGIAHTEMDLLCELLAKVEGPAREAAADGRAALSRAAANVASVLSVARARPSQIAGVDVAEVVEAALFDLEPRLGGLTVVRELDAAPCARADRGALLQALVSLLLDAADAAQAHGRILVRVRGEGGYVVICIEDDGPSPISPESLPDSPGSPLWISRSAVRSFGGELSGASSPMGGRQVIIRLRAV